MANAIEKLFDSIPPSLQPQQADPWPEGDWDFDEPMPEDDDRGSPNDLVLPIADGWSGAVAGLGSPGSSASVTEDDRELIEGGLRHRGMEVLAFYKSRRFLAFKPFPGKWGVFYLQPGLAYLHAEIEAQYPGICKPAELALEFLRKHEHFHFRADVQTLLFEATLRHHLYLPLRTAMRGRSVDFVEEALANRQVMQWAQMPSVGIREFAHDFMKLQPGAYARFDEPRLVLGAEWAGTVVDLKPPGTHLREDLAAWVEATPKDFLRASLCPEYLVRPVDLSTWISPAFNTPPVNSVVDGEKVRKALGGRYAQLATPWETTKRKLVADRHLGGLNFKPWPKEGRDAYSVRVDEKFRAHLRHESGGNWMAYKIGNHKEMGHG